jgi:asparagine synthase (glutamine-hydrolysing)
MARAGAQVQAYTASFPEGRDESSAASRAAEIFGARHIRIEVSAKDFWSALPRVIDHMDDPVSDAAIVPTFILAREAVKDLKVVLCGEGGDELFAGYSRYRRQARPRWLGGRVRRRKGPFSGAGVLRSEPLDWREGIVTAETEANVGGRSRLQVAQVADCADFLPHYLLTKVDRSLMANGVEGRTPFLDRSVAALGLTLPERLKLRRGLGKYLVRAWLDKQASQEDCFAKKKGFTPPYLHWVRAEGERLGPLVAADPAIEELCVPGTVAPLFLSDDREKLEAAWRLLFFSLWRRRHVLGRRLGDDVRENLAMAA